MSDAGSGPAPPLGWREYTGGALLALVLVATAILGAGDVAEQVRSASLAGQKLSLAAEATYSAAAFATLAGLALRRRWGRVALRVWAASVVATAFLAPIYWGGQGLRVGLLSGLGALAVAWLVLRLGRRAVQARVGTPTPEEPRP